MRDASNVYAVYEYGTRQAFHSEMNTKNEMNKNVFLLFSDESTKNHTIYAKCMSRSESSKLQLPFVSSTIIGQSNRRVGYHLYICTDRLVVGGSGGGDGGPLSRECMRIEIRDANKCRILFFGPTTEVV